MNNLNFVTTSMLIAWPVVALWLFKTRPVGQAILWTILGGYMLLPVGAEIKFSMIPLLDKNSIPSLTALFGCVVVCGKSLRVSRGIGYVEILIITLVITPFITSELNTDPVPIGRRILPGLDSYEAGSAVISQAITLIPFFLGRRFFRSGSDIEGILRVLVVAGLVYSVPSLLEVRLSPQLHTWIYGYFPHSFEQQMRDGGFRPIVFMGHGLLVAFFICTTTAAAAVFWRTKTQVARTLRLPASGITAYLGFVLVLCKTASATLYAAILVPLVLFTKPRMQLSIAVLLTSVALLYPVLRSADLVPTNMLLDWAGSINPDREKSLEVRFINENQLLQRASQRFLFGWGRYGRSFIYDANGNETSLTDGTWIITLGEFGFIGFLASFGLLALPVFAAARSIRFSESSRDELFLSTLALIMAISAFDLLPNSSIRPWTWLVAGALLGRAEALRDRVRLQVGFRTGLATSTSK
jgi:hypothetical protein